MVVFSVFFVCLVIFNLIQDVNLSCWRCYLFLFSVNIFELCSEMKLSYLETVLFLRVISLNLLDMTGEMFTKD